MIYRKQLEGIREQLEQRRNDLEDDLKFSPEGSLTIVNRDGSYMYYQRIPKGGNRKKEHRIGITKQTELIFALVRKKYMERALNALTGDIMLLDDLLHKYENTDENSVMKSFAEKYPQLTQGIYYGEVDKDIWEGTYFQDKSFYPEDLRSESVHGEKMRSDGELYIAGRLDHYQIAYRYEAELNIPDIGYVPDFTILRPTDGKLIYWEHFGMTGDPRYVSNNIYKVSKYIEYGITPWENLIMTYNYKNGGFNAKLIDAMIDGWLMI